jgi:hypothetical protein
MPIHRNNVCNLNLNATFNQIMHALTRPGTPGMHLNYTHAMHFGAYDRRRPSAN